MKATVKSVVKRKDPFHGNFQGRPYVVYEAVVSGCIDGGPEEELNLKTGKKDVFDGIAPGKEFEVEKQDRKGFISYKILNAPAKQQGGGGFGGFGAMTPARENSIIAQTCLKAAVECLSPIKYDNDLQESGLEDERLKAHAGAILTLATCFFSWVQDRGEGR